jgi:precorrin-6B methylase 2
VSAAPATSGAGDADLQALLQQAVMARRRGRLDAAREQFGRVRDAAAARAEPGARSVAEAYLALIDDDRSATEAAVARLVEVEPTSPTVAALGMLMAERWPPSPRPRETHLVSRKGAFRRMCRKLPQAGEVALELGASHGIATGFLALKCARVYAVEKSPEMADLAREATAHSPNVTVIVADTEEPGLVRAYVPRADLVFIDIGGSTPLRVVIHAAWVYGNLYQPRAMVIRSVNLNAFVASLASFERDVAHLDAWGRLG